MRGGAEAEWRGRRIIGTWEEMRAANARSRLNGPFRKKKRGPFSAVIAVTFPAERVGRVSLARLDDDDVDDDERDDCLSPPQGKMPNLLNTLVTKFGESPTE